MQAYEAYISILTGVKIVRTVPVTMLENVSQIVDS